MIPEIIHLTQILAINCRWVLVVEKEVCTSKSMPYQALIVKSSFRAIVNSKIHLAESGIVVTVSAGQTVFDLMLGQRISRSGIVSISQGVEKRAPWFADLHFDRL